MTIHAKDPKRKRHYNKGGGVTLVNKSGYVSKRQMIENVKMAGVKLRIARDEQYDDTGTMKDPSQIEIKPYRNKHFTKQDAIDYINERRRKREDALRKQAADRKNPDVSDKSEKEMSEAKGDDVVSNDKSMEVEE